MENRRLHWEQHHSELWKTIQLYNGVEVGDYQQNRNGFSASSEKILRDDVIDIDMKQNQN